MVQNSNWKQIKETIKDNVNVEGDMPVGPETDKSLDLARRDLNAWKKYGGVEKYTDIKDGISVVYDPDHELNNKFDRYFANVYTCRGKTRRDNGTGAVTVRKPF
jgi:hypothetical protein